MSYYDQEDEPRDEPRDSRSPSIIDDVEEEERLSTRQEEAAVGIPVGGAVVTRCEACGGAGKVCGECDRPMASCRCVDFRRGREVSGFTPVVCGACEGTGEAE